MTLSRRAVLALPALFAAPALLVSRPLRAETIGTAARPLRVGVTSGVHAQVLEKVRDVLAREGLVLRATEFGDFIQPNVALAGGDIDANTYQHLPFLQAQEHDRGYHFAAVGRTVLTVMGVFSRKVKSLADLPQGARIAIPNDPTNGGRALLLLAQGGAFTLRPGVDFRATVMDIADNPHKVRIVELDAAQIARSLPDVDAAAITGNYAVPAGLNPMTDALAVEKGDSIYTCLVVVRAGDETAPWAQALARAYGAPEIKQYVASAFGGAVIPGV